MSVTSDALRSLAGDALSYFEYRRRPDDGSGYWALEESAPAWLRELVWAAHNNGGMLPDDARYLYVVEALEALADNPEEPESMLEPEPYTSNLLQWLAASPSYRMGLVDEAVQESGWDGLFAALQAGQRKEKEEVLYRVRAFLAQRIEAGEED